MKRFRIGTVTAITLCMCVMPLAGTLLIVKATEPYVQHWEPLKFGVIFAAIHFALIMLGAWLFATRVN